MKQKQQGRSKIVSPAVAKRALLIKGVDHERCAGDSKNMMCSNGKISMTHRKIRDTVIALEIDKKNLFHHENIAYKRRPYLNEHCMSLHYMSAVLPIARELRSGFRPTNHGETSFALTKG